MSCSGPPSVQGQGGLWTSICRVPEALGSLSCPPVSLICQCFRPAAQPLFGEGQDRHGVRRPQGPTSGRERRVPPPSGRACSARAVGEGQWRKPPSYPVSLQGGRVSCEPRISLYLRSRVIDSVPVWTLNYTVIPTREESGGRWPEANMGRGENGLLLISCEFTGHGQQPKWDCQAWREGRAVARSPRRSPGAARPDRLSEGTASVEAKGTDCNQPPGFQSQPL